MAFIETDEINNIRQNANIIDIISSYIPLTQKGKNYFGVCPFHSDHSPSMSVSFDKQIYKCFSCGATGNVFTFVSNYENVSFSESVSIVANKIGLSLGVSIDSKKNTKYDKYYNIMNISMKFYQNNLNTDIGSLARKYLKERKINNDIIKDFRIGLSLDENDLLLTLLDKKDYSKEDLLNLGLINKNGISYYDVFTKRLMFPLENVDGQVIGFSGRIYKSVNDSKYINTKETEIFKKGRLLFNYHRAKKYVKQANSIIIVEGFMDAIRLYSEGIYNVVAIMGTSLTNYHIDFLKKLRCKIVLCLDNDTAGESATYSIGNELISNDFNVDVIRLSDAKDPDEYVIKYGIDAFIKNINNAFSFNDFKLNYLKKDKNLNNSLEASKYITEVLKSLDNCNDDILKELTINKLSKEFNVPSTVLKEKITTNNKLPVIKEKVFIIKNKRTKYDLASEKMLFYMMNDVKYIKSFTNKIGYFSKKIYRDVANEILYFYETNKFISLADFISYSNFNEYVHGTVMSIISKCNNEELNNDDFDKYLIILNEDNEINEINKLKEKLKNETDANRKVLIAEKIAKLKKGVFNNGK